MKVAPEVPIVNISPILKLEPESKILNADTVPPVLVKLQVASVKVAAPR